MVENEIPARAVFGQVARTGLKDMENLPDNHSPRKALRDLAATHRDTINEAKRRLPLPELMARLGDGEIAKSSARCPFHEDHSPSFGIFKGESGAWLWKCQAGCGSGDEITYLEKRHGLANGAAIGEYLKLAGVESATAQKPTAAAFDWQACRDAFTLAHAQSLATWRGYSLDFVRWLHARGSIGLHRGRVAFPNHGPRGEVVSAHVRTESGDWIFQPKGQRTAPLVFGDVATAGFVLAFESQWDALAAMDRLDFHTGEASPDTAVFVTRGASNARLFRGKVAADAVVYGFAQNDKAGEAWLADLAAAAGCRVLRVATPAPHKDANDWTRAGATKAQIEAAMHAAKPVAAESPAPRIESGSTPEEITSAIRGQIVAILSNDKLSTAEQRTRIADSVVRALSERGQFFYHAERRDFDSAMFFDNQRKHLERVRSDAFGAWLSDWLRVNRADTLFRYVAAAVETVALSEGQAVGILPETFWASRPGAIYLSNGDGRIVKITAGKSELADNGIDSVLFAAGNTLAPWTLTSPEDPFDTCSIFGAANCAAKHGPDLLRLWLYSLPLSPPSKPPLCLAGDVGSGKTRFVKGVAELYGLPFVANKVEDFGEDSFWASLDAGGLFTLDNADTRNKWLADAVASASTDGCSQRRKLYTDAETVTLRARAWLCLTTANPTFASDAGLADRLLVVRMNRRTDETADAKLSEEIRQHRDAGLSFITQTLAAAMADTKPTPPALNQRHPDFAAFAVRVGRAVGREPQTLAALRAAEMDKSLFCLENDNVAAALLAYLTQAPSFNGTAAELLPHVCEMDADLKERLSTKRLSKRLAMLWPHLLKTLAVAKKETDRKGFIVFTLQAGKTESADFADFQTAF